MDKIFTASLSNPDTNVYVTLELPADPYAVMDAWERLRPAPDTRVVWDIEDYGEFPILFHSTQPGKDFPAANALAERLAGLDDRQRTAFNGLVKLAGKRMEIDALMTLAEQARHCHVVPEATDDAQLGRFYAVNGFIPEVVDVPDQVFELLDFELLGRRIRLAEGGVFTRQGYVVPDGAWQPTQGRESPAAPEPPKGIFHLELCHKEQLAGLTLPAADRELIAALEELGAKGFQSCSVTSFHSRVPQIPAEWAVPERMDVLNRLAQRLAVLAEQDPPALIKYKAVLEASPPSSLEGALALTERLDAYSLDRSAVTPGDVAHSELYCAMGAEEAGLLEPYVSLHRYGEALIQQYGGQLTDYGLLTRADRQPVQGPLPPRPRLGGMEMR